MLSLLLSSSAFGWNWKFLGSVNWFRLICISYFIWKWLFFFPHIGAELGSDDNGKCQQQRRWWYSHHHSFFVHKTAIIPPWFFPFEYATLVAHASSPIQSTSEFSAQKYTHARTYTHTHTCKCHNFIATIRISACTNRIIHTFPSPACKISSMQQ